MADPESTAGAVLEALGFALFERNADGALRLTGPAPAWLLALWPGIAETGVPLDDASPFLGNFLVDAGAAWEAGGASQAKSGPWVERGARDAEVHLEATALTTGGRAVLLVERLGEDFAARKSVLQKARETVIAYQRLNTEMQKKEILLHCLAEDMTAALGNIITSLRLMELEQNPATIRQLLGLASQATQEQQGLINRVLAVFAEELEETYGRAGQAVSADLHAALRRAAQTSASLFQEKGVTFAPLPAAAGPLPVAADGTHLERVLTSLLENALEHSPAGAAVEIRVEDEGDSVLVQVQDGGAEIAPDLHGRLFTQFDSGTATSVAALLRLHFCRIAVENWHGEIGHTPLERGNCFWIRLPKPVESR